MKEYLVEYFYENDINSGESIQYDEEEIVEILSDEDFSKLDETGSIELFPPKDEDGWEDIMYYTIKEI